MVSMVGSAKQCASTPKRLPSCRMWRSSSCALAPLTCMACARSARKSIKAVPRSATEHLPADGALAGVHVRIRHEFAVALQALAFGQPTQGFRRAAVVDVVGDFDGSIADFAATAPDQAHAVTQAGAPGRAAGHDAGDAAAVGLGLFDV